VLTGTLMALAGAVCWSFANMSIQSVARRLGSWSALVWIQLIGTATVVVAAYVFEGAPKVPDTATLTLIVVAGLSALLAYVGLFESLRRGQVAVVTPVIASWSVVSVVIGVFQMDAPLGAAAALGIGLLVAGNVLLARYGRSRTGNITGTPTAALLWAGAATLGFGCMVPAVDAAGRALGRLWTIPMVWGVELTLLIPVLWLSGRLSRMPSGTQDWWEVARTAACEAGGLVAVSLALDHAPLTLVSPVASLSTAVTVALGVLLLRERLRTPALLGAALASLGVVLVNLL
jgi:uncharacterized membrane protein